MARKGIRYSQQDPSPRKGVKKDCEECQRLYKAVKTDRWFRRARHVDAIIRLPYVKAEEADTAALRAHVATHA